MFCAISIYLLVRFKGSSFDFSKRKIPALLAVVSGDNLCQERKGSLPATDRVVRSFLMVLPLQRVIIIFDK
jgi:hypothetical protein